MKSFKTFITEAAEKGDCFPAAFRWALSLDDRVADQSWVVHGMVSGQGRLEGLRFAHAWGEIGTDVVIDNSNGKKRVVRRADYYKAGKIDESSLFRYPIHKALIKSVRAKHYGPWDFRGDTEGKRINTNEERIIIKRRAEIGKKHIRLSASDKKKIESLVSL